MNPKVSVVIPVFNREEYVVQTIESVLSQTFQDFELLVVDDGSSDDSSLVIKRYAEQYAPKVRYLCHPDQRNHGVSASRNLGAREARGPYIAYLDSDDVWLPEKLERQVHILDTCQDIGLVLCALKVIDQAGNPTQKIFGTSTIFNEIPARKRQAFALLFSKALPLSLCSAALIRKELLFQIGLFDHGLLCQHEDSIAAIKLAYISRIYCLHEPLIKYRIHDGNAFWYMIPPQKVHYQTILRVCQWLRKNSTEFELPQFRVELAHLTTKAYYNRCISRWNCLTLLIYLLYPKRTWKCVKICTALLLGSKLTHIISKSMRYDV